MTLMTSKQDFQDPNWQEISASQRDGVLHLKMPRGKITLLIWGLMKVGGDLAPKETRETEHSFFFSGPTEDWTAEHEILRAKIQEAPRNLLAGPLVVLEEFVGVVERGLRNDPAVDWIARVKGPAEKQGQP